jgi:hypothetical protein
VKPAFFARCLSPFLLCFAAGAASQTPHLVSADTSLILADTLAPLGVLASGDRVFASQGDWTGAYAFKLARVTPDGFRVWGLTLQFQGLGARIVAVLEGPEKATWIHYQQDDGLYMKSIDRFGVPGPQLTLVPTLESYGLWKSASGFGDTLAAGGQLGRYDHTGAYVVHVFTRGGIPVRRIALPGPPGYVRIVAAVEGGNILLSEWETAGVVRTLWLRKIDTTGATVWRKSYDGGPDGDITSILTLPDGYLVGGNVKATGPENHDAWLFKIGFDGDVKWARTWGDRWDDRIHVIMPCRNGGFLLGGQRTVFTTKKEARGSLHRVGADGDSVWNLLLESHPVVSMIEPAPGVFHLTGGSDFQKKWFGVLSPENPASMILGHTGDPVPRILRQDNGDLLRLAPGGYGLIQIRADGRIASTFRMRVPEKGPVTLPLRPGPGGILVIRGGGERLVLGNRRLP